MSVGDRENRSNAKKDFVLEPDGVFLWLVVVGRSCDWECRMRDGRS